MCSRALFVELAIRRDKRINSCQNWRQQIGHQELSTFLRSQTRKQLGLRVPLAQNWTRSFTEVAKTFRRRCGDGVVALPREETGGSRPQR